MIWCPMIQEFCNNNSSGFIFFAAVGGALQADLMAAIERGTVHTGGTIRGTQRGRMLQQIDGIKDLKAQLAKYESREAKMEAKMEAREAMLNEQLAKKDSQIEKLMAKLL